jgi:hypothetical protein
MTTQDHDLMRAEDDGMIVRESHHPENTDPPASAAAHYSSLLREAQDQDAQRDAQELAPGTRVRSTRRNDRGKIEGWDDDLGLPIIGWESATGLEACTPHEYEVADGEGLAFHRMQHIRADAIAEWTVGDYLQDGSLAPGGEILLRLMSHKDLGVQLQAFSDGTGTLRRFLEMEVFEDMGGGSITPRQVEKLLEAQGVPRPPDTSKQISELQAQDHHDDLRRDAEADTAIESEDQ